MSCSFQSPHSGKGSCLRVIPTNTRNSRPGIQTNMIGGADFYGWFCLIFTQPLPLKYAAVQYESGTNLRLRVWANLLCKQYVSPSFLPPNEVFEDVSSSRMTYNVYSHRIYVPFGDKFHAVRRDSVGKLLSAPHNNQQSHHPLAAYFPVLIYRFPNAGRGAACMAGPQSRAAL
jgi:hypothetical protein